MEEASPPEPLWPHVASGVAGRIAAEVFMSPINLIKVRLQHSNQKNAQNFGTVVKQLARHEGLALWRGLPPRLAWSAPLAAATFTYYNAAKNVVAGQDTKSEAKAQNSSVISPEKRVVLLGPVMLAASVALRTPFDIVEQKMQILPYDEKVPAYRRALLVMKDVAKSEGIRGLWRGYSAAFCGVGCFVTGYFLVYEAVRRLLGPSFLAVKSETAINLISGGVGGGCTALFATPFDTIKVRMQTKLYANASNPNPSAIAVARATVQDLGFRGLYRGAGARVASNTPSGAIMFSVYEAGTRYSRRQREERAKFASVG